MSRLYALLVGINDYPANVGKLQGCVNDVENFEEFLRSRFDDPAIVALKDQQATRANIIEQFRAHLGQSGPDDIALFHYAGHGSPATAAAAFHEFDLSGDDQGLICIDSRNGSTSYDLADKELAQLIQEVARRDPHITIILDCCFSGTGTRSIEDPANEGVRTSHARPAPRPIESYLEGQYAQAVKAGQRPTIPAPRHMLLAACDRRQTAKEDLETHRGIFTTNLLEVLRRSATPPSYADLFVQSRAAVRRYISDKGKTPQDPQFEAIGDFDGYTAFLGQARASARRTYEVYGDGNGWHVDFGAVHGAPTSAEKPVTFALYAETGGETAAGIARTTQVGAQKSDLLLDFPAEPGTRFKGELISLPAAPCFIRFAGDSEAAAALQSALDRAGAPIILAEAAGGDEYSLRAEDGRLALSGRGRTIFSVALTAPDWTDEAVRLLRHVDQWERSLALDNLRPQLDPALVDFVFAEQRPGGADETHQGPAITLEDRRNGGRWEGVIGTLKVRNRTGQPLHAALLHLTSDFAVRVVVKDEIAATGEWMTLSLGGASGKPEVNFFIDDGGDEAVERLKLLVSTEPVDGFLIELDPLDPTRGFGRVGDPEGPAAKPVANDWFSKDMIVSIVRAAEPGPSADAAPTAARPTMPPG